MMVVGMDGCDRALHVVQDKIENGKRGKKNLSDIALTSTPQKHSPIRSFVCFAVVGVVVAGWACCGAAGEPDEPARSETG